MWAAAMQKRKVSKLLSCTKREREKIISGNIW